MVVATLDSTSIPAGESVTAALRVENRGDLDGTYEAMLIVDGEVVTTKSLDVEAGGSGVAAFEHRFDEPGEYRVALGDTSLGTVTVTAPDRTTPTRTDDAGGDDAGIAVVEATLPADWVREGFETVVRARVENTADRTATRTLSVRVDGTPVGNETVTLEPNESAVVTVEFEAVAGTVSVEGIEAGRIEVSEPRQEGRTEDDTEPPGPSPDLAFAAIVSFVGILTGVGVYVTRRYR